MKYITLDRRHFLAGASTSDESNDGGFSPSSYNLNPSKTPGIMYGTADPVAIATAPTGSIIAYSQDPNIYGKDALLISNNHKIYTLDGSTLTNTATLATKQFQQSNANLVPFNGFLVGTTRPADQDLVKMTFAGAITTETWWTGAGELNQSALSASTADRPLIVFEKHLYIGDLNKIHRVSSAPTVSNGIVTLETFDNITALGVDPSTGKILVAFQRQGFNGSATRTAPSFIGIYDGVSDTLDRLVPIQGKVTAFYSVGGTMFVAYQNNIGYWTGVGVKFLRKLNRASLSGAELVNQNKIVSSGQTLLFADKDEVVAFGEITRGAPVFRTIYRAGSTITALFLKNSTTLAVAENTTLKTIDLTSTHINAFLRSNRYYFDEPVEVKKIEILYKESVNASLGTTAVVLYDDTGDGVSKTITNTTAVGQKVLSAVFNGKPTNSFYITASQNSGAYGWLRIRVGYQPTGEK